MRGRFSACMSVCVHFCMPAGENSHTHTQTHTQTQTHTHTHTHTHMLFFSVLYESILAIITVILFSIMIWAISNHSRQDLRGYNYMHFSEINLFFQISSPRLIRYTKLAQHQQEDSFPNTPPPPHTSILSHLLKGYL